MPLKPRSSTKICWNKRSSSASSGTHLEFPRSRCLCQCPVKSSDMHVQRTCHGASSRAAIKLTLSRQRPGATRAETQRWMPIYNQLRCHQVIGNQPPKALKQHWHERQFLRSNGCPHLRCRQSVVRYLALPAFVCERPVLAGQRQSRLDPQRTLQSFLR